MMASERRQRVQVHASAYTPVLWMVLPSYDSATPCTLSRTKQPRNISSSTGREVLGHGFLTCKHRQAAPAFIALAPHLHR